LNRPESDRRHLAYDRSWHARFYEIKSHQHHADDGNDLYVSLINA
jgi:hypothetical protein